MRELSTKPYLIRAIYEWCSDSGFTPYLSVKVDAQTRVPEEFVKNGEIILNVSHDAAHHLTLGDDVIQFSARFSGISREVSIPVSAVQGIFAKETSKGILFPPEEETHTAQNESNIEEPEKQPSPQDGSSAAGKKRRFQVVK
jgi:stringent starvation protein B